MLFVYGRILSQQLVNTMSTDKFFYKLVSGLLKYQMVICYFLYIAGLFTAFIFFSFLIKEDIMISFIYIYIKHSCMSVLSNAVDMSIKLASSFPFLVLF